MSNGFRIGVEQDFRPASAVISKLGL